MATKETRFEITLPFKIEKVVEDKPEPFFECKLEYHDMDYEEIVAIQAAMVELLERLNGFGFDTAAAMGLGEKLKALGLAKKA